MSPSCSRVRAAILVIAALGLFTDSNARAGTSAPDSLTLQTPADVKAWSVYDRGLKRFVVWLTWRESPDSCATFVHPPDVSGWAVTTPPAQMSQPAVRGAYNGDIDRTFIFRSTRNATVGEDSVVLNVDIRQEEEIASTIYLRPSSEPGGYVPGTWIPVRLRDLRTNELIDFGFEFSLGPGETNLQGSFAVGAEDFEGFHIWRGIEPDGSDMVIIGELSKQEAFLGAGTGGSFADSLYFYDVIPTLRQSMPWFSGFGAVECLGNRIDLPLESDQLFWWDCNANNGFTYYYAVTAFDRGYNVGSSSQGLVKVDHCTVAQGVPYSCPDELVPLKMEVDPQDDLYNVYAVPNPFRSGGSRLTSENYHNFPDDYIRFVNVPDKCVVKIFNVAGDLVWETSHNAPTGNIEWDVTNRDSQPVTSGVYLYRVETPSGDSVYGRIIVIR